MEQMIKIDVPDGYEFNYFEYPRDYGKTNVFAVARFKKKEPEFIEVREYLWRSESGNCYTSSIEKINGTSPSATENCPGFIRWIDQTWRKVEI